ncbi:MAG: hypothetical protein AAF437_00825 [Pseudomonadota bacterium]
MFRSAVLSSLAVAIVPLAAHADKTCLVSKFQYYDKGGYIAKNFTIRNQQTGDERGGNAGLSETLTFVIKEQAGISEGNEVWLEYVVVDVINHQISCRKNGTKLVFDSARGNTWNYKSKGSASDGNRCRFGDNDCIEP